METVRKATVVAIFVFLTSLAGTVAAQQPDAFEQVKRMARGVNIIGYDPLWRDRAKARFQEKHFAMIHDAGFSTVRINLHALGRMDADNRVDPAWLGTLDWAVKGALAAKLMVILDLHNYNEVAKDPELYKPRIMAFWKEIATRFKDAPDSVVFEILNEPNGKLTPELWNQYLREALAIIRQGNPTRTVVVGPPYWNGIKYLDKLELPEDDQNLIVTVHYYQPMRFTHQGARWTPEYAQLTGVTWGTDADKRRVDDDFAAVQAWSKAHQRPILLGEFGAYDKADVAQRAAYISYVARAAETLGWAWTYWQFDSDFVVYDMKRDQWVEPILDALVPPH